MSTSLPPTGPTSTDIIEIERLLTSALVTRPLTPEALERMRSTVTQAWGTKYVPQQKFPNRRRSITGVRWVGLAIAASLVAATLTFIAVRPVGEQELVGSLARASDGGIERDARFFRRHTLAVGEPLRVGDTLTTRGSALVLLAQGGTLRLAGGSVISVVAASHIQLERGAIYIDKPVNLPQVDPLRVETHSGMVDHLGTEFEVLSTDQLVRVRVREGQIRFSGALGVMIAGAGTELISSSTGRITQQPAPTYGRDWQWAAALAPDFAIEGRSLLDYLQWISRELGRPLRFANEQVRESARRTVLHGSAQSHATLDALADVLSSTTLSYDLVDGAIRVHSDG